LGRTLRQVNKGFDGTDIYTDKTYNMLGQVYQSSDPYFSTAQPEWTTYSYDPYGRNKSVNAPTGNVTMAYNTRSVTTTNTSASPQQVFTKTINALGMLISSVDAGGTVSYAYYSSGKPKNITSPGSVVTSMLYDSWGNQTQLMEPNAGTIGYTYDAFHQLLTQSKNGVASSLTYDGLGRLKTLVETEGTTTYTYDTKTNGKGLLAGISAPGGVSGDYNYDSYCRLLSKTETIDGLNFTESLQYDSYGRLLTLTYPSAFGITYNYNNNYYLSEIKRTDNNASIWKAQVMNARGQIEQYTLGNGLITAQTFDHGFVTGIQTGSVQNLQYNWDKTTGNLTWRKDATRNLTENFSYDNLSRLTGITGNTTASYTFAANGNIATGTAAGTYTYNATKLHAVASVTNPLGSISSTDQIIQYTSFDKVKLITEGAKTVNLYYGADKERRKMVYNDGTNTLTRYYAHGNYEKESGTNNRELFYITAGTGVAAIYEKKAAGNQMYYISKDHLGSVNVITNESGAVVEEMSFDAWGRRRNPVNWTIRVFRQPMLSTVATPVMNTSTSLELLI
jgi:YD repeat-containing protein